MSRTPVTPPTGRDRRRILRRAIPSIRAAFEAGELRGVGHLKNISKEGLFLRSDILPQPGTEIRILFHDRQGNKIELHGTVRWTTAQLANDSGARPGFGIQFSKADGAFRDFYEEILTR
jgi:PilZ domain